MIFIVLSLLAFFCLNFSLNIQKTVVYFILFLLACIFSNTAKATVNKNRRYRISFFLTAAIILFSANRFYCRWIFSSMIRRIAAAFHMNPSLFLSMSGVVLSITSFYGLYYWITRISSKDIWDRLKLNNGRGKGYIYNQVLFLLLLFLQFFSLQRSSLDWFEDIFRVNYRYVTLNLLILCGFNIIFVIILQNRRIGLLISSVAICIIAISNIYVILYHGSPLLPSELVNTATALEVVSKYSFALKPELIDVLAFFLFEIVAILFMGNSNPKFRVTHNISRLIVIGLNSVVLSYFVLFPNSPNLSIQWSWRNLIQDAGYISCCIGDIKNMLFPIKEPVGYSSESIVVPEIDNSNATDEYPDIILILNESFCDLDVYNKINPDVDYFAPFYLSEETYTGYALSPSIGGGTNNSEYELLTSNSMYLMNCSAPFNYLDFHNVGLTAVTYLNALGYETTAMHCGRSTNYSRDKAFPEMGFDHVYLEDSSFFKKSLYGNRPFLDSDNYSDLLSLYEKDTGGPRFYYLLTYQNHGGYEQNDSSFDMVHTDNDFEDLTDDVNEYISSVSLSVDAFSNLIKNLSESKRKTVVAMVGDHAPSFISHISPSRSMSPEESDALQRVVPFALWANFDLDLDKSTGGTEFFNMTDLFPFIMSVSNMPLTPYYKEILDLHNIMPARTSAGYYVDDFQIESFIDDIEKQEMLNKYYYMEYNNLSGPNNWIGELFELKPMISNYKRRVSEIENTR